ncbi:MAG: hypothetical protein U0637_09895 [Phycisphaerales bacterium]
MTTATTASAVPPPLPSLPSFTKAGQPSLRAAVTRTWLCFGVCTTVLGTFWLLSTLHYLPDINWVWVLALAAIGFVPLVVAGLNKFSFAFCGFMLACSTASMLRQMHVATWNITVPSLVIAAGVMALASMALPLRLPRWLEEAGGPA